MGSDEPAPVGKGDSGTVQKPHLRKRRVGALLAGAALVATAVSPAFAHMSRLGQELPSGSWLDVGDAPVWQQPDGEDQFETDQGDQADNNAQGQDQQTETPAPTDNAQGEDQHARTPEPTDNANEDNQGGEQQAETPEPTDNANEDNQGGEQQAETPEPTDQATQDGQGGDQNSDGTQPGSGDQGDNSGGD